MTSFLISLNEQSVMSFSSAHSPTLPWRSAVLPRVDRTAALYADRTHSQSGLFISASFRGRSPWILDRCSCHKRTWLFLSPNFSWEQRRSAVFIVDKVCPLVLGAEHDSCCLVCGPFLLPLFIYSFGTESVFFFFLLTNSTLFRRGLCIKYCL